MEKGITKRHYDLGGMPIEVIHFPQLESTNDTVRSYVSEKRDMEGLLVRADVQTKGRGRLNRKWENVGSGLLMFSFALTGSPDVVRYYTLLAGWGVCKGLKDISPGVGLKWPNDILNNRGSKICGILCESVVLNSEQSAVIIGIGVNLFGPNDRIISPAGLEKKAGFLLDQEMTQEEIDLLAAKIYKNIHTRSAALNKDRDYGKLISDWKSYCINLGHNASAEVEADGEQFTVQGIFSDVTIEGYACITDSNGVQYQVIAGDLNFGF